MDENDQGRTAAGGPRRISRDQLAAVADALTMGDVWKAQKAAPDDRVERGLQAFYTAAQRIGVVGREVGFADFVDMIGQADFRAVNEAAAEGKDQG